MPLIKSGSKDAVSKNIATERAAGKPQRQAVAIAMDIARRAERALGGRMAYADGGSADNRNMSRAISERAMRGLDPTPEQQKYLDEMQALRDQRGDENLSAIKFLGNLDIPMPDAKKARQVSDRAMRGYEPTPEQRSFLDESAPGKDARTTAPGALGYVGAELTGVPQYFRAGEAIKDAAQEPSIASLTNAGVHSLAALGRYGKAAGVGIGGLGVAGAKDAGLFDMGANAQQGKQQTTLPKLPPEMNAEYTRLVAKAAQNNYISRDDRNNTLSRIKELQALSNELVGKEVGAKQSVETDAARKKLEEDERAVKTAESARNTELGRQRRFSDTEVGKVWDKMGGWGPAVVGAAAGLTSRMATGPGKSTFGSLMKDYALPGTLGAGLGAASNNVPLAYNAFMTEPDNPEKRAYEAYARELPPSHERKQEWTDYASKLPDANPVRKQAAEELYDWEKAKERMLFGGIEGLGGGILGSELVRIPGRAFNWATGKGGATPTQPSGSPSTPSPRGGAPLRADDVDTRMIGQEMRRAEPPMLEARPNPETLAEKIQAQNRLLGPVETPNLPVASAAPAVAEPKMFNGAPLPPGWDLNSRGLPYNVHTGQTIGKKHYTAKEEGKKAPSRKSSKPSKKADSEQLGEIPIKPDRPIGGDFGPFARGGVVGRAFEIARNMGGRVLTGPVTHRADGGRTDTVKTNLPSNSYVIPADIISSLGEGDTNAGYRVLESMFGSHETAADTGEIPAIVAGGEYVLSPEQVARIGNGDPDLAFHALDQFVKMQRRKHIQTLKSLPAPVKD